MSLERDRRKSETNAQAFLFSVGTKSEVRNLLEDGARWY